MIEFAIVGLGSWGLAVLERTVSLARRSGVAARVHVVEPGQPGGGVYNVSQPDYLVLNNACGQLSLYASPDEGADPPYGLGLFEWCVRNGYRWSGHECRRDHSGIPVTPGDYLPRRVMGEYLSWFYRTLVAAAPGNLEIVHHPTRAADIVAELGGERLQLEDGGVLHVGHVVLTSGHTWNDEPVPTPGGVSFARPYPVEHFSGIAPGSSLAVAGMGLVAYDLLAASSIGRGGRFDPAGARLSYRPSGREPSVLLYSRSGMPYCAKSAEGTDPTGDYEPVVCTAEQFAALPGRAERRQVDFRLDLLPLLYAEMQCRYHLHCARRRGGEALRGEVERALRDGWDSGHFEKVVEVLEGADGRFVPAEHLFPGTGRRYASGRDYEGQVYGLLEADLDEALMPGGSPVKAALEVTRILRDRLRSVIEFGGLTIESYVDFQSAIRGQINRIEAGPPPMRSQQLLALIDAGIVRLPFGPSPEVAAAPGGAVVRSRELLEPAEETVRCVVRGHLDMPSLARSASPLLRRLYGKGRLTQLSYGDTPVGSVSISEDFHPFDAEGRLQAGLSLLGVLTEGARYFTHYLPSPKSRMRAVRDAEACVEAILG